MLLPLLLNLAESTPYADSNPFTITITPNRGGGKKRKKRYFVEVDGRRFVAEDAQHARALLERAAELARKAAETQVEPALNRARRVGKASITPPTLATDAPLDLAPYERAIREAYDEAARLAEMRLLMELEDDEDAAYLLL